MKTRLLLVPLAFLLSGCAGTAPQVQDPFDVALGIASLNIMNPDSSSNAGMDAFKAAMQPPTVIQQTVVQEVKPAQGGPQ